MSYEAVRNYHYDREPPVSYLARVVEVFSEFRLEWLATGEGPAVESHREIRGEALHEAITSAYPEKFNLLPPRAQDLFLAFLMKRMRSAKNPPDWVRGVAWESPGDVPEEVVEHAGDLLYVLLRPIWRETRPEGEAGPAALPAWGVRDARNVIPDRLERYVRRFLDALEEMTPAPGDGHFLWADAEKARDRRDRQAIEADRKMMAEHEAEIDDQRPQVGDKDPGEDA